MKADQERVRNLLTDTVTLLCKNGLQYQTELRVQGVLGITLDNKDVFIVHINEKFGGDISGAISIHNDEGDAAKTLLGGVRVDTKKSRGESETPVAVNTKIGEVVHRRRRRSRESLTSPAMPTNSSQQHTLQRPIKRLMPFSREESLSGVKHTSLLNSTGNQPAESVCEDISVVKVKTEEEDVLIIEESEDSKAEILGSSQNIPNTTDQSAMLDSYPNHSLSEIHGSYQPFGEVPDVSNSSTNSGVDGAAPPPIKRRATGGSTHDSFSGSSEMEPDGSGSFITGMMRNDTRSGDVAPQTTTATPWDPSQDISSLSAQDSQMILDSTPGCSTWDTSQQSQMSASGTPYSLPNVSDQSSESIRAWSRYPMKNLTGRAVKCALEAHLVEPVRSFGDRVLGFRVTWRVKGAALSHAWDDIVRQRHLCDEAVARTTSLQMFVSCISGLRTNATAASDVPIETPVYPAVGYWAVLDAAAPGDSYSELMSRMTVVCPSAEVKRISPVNIFKPDVSVDATTCSTLFGVLKDHNGGFVRRKIALSILRTGGAIHDPQPRNAKLVLVHCSKYAQFLVPAVDALKKAGLCFDMELLERSL